MGIKIEDDLINDKARGLWLEWKRRTDPLHYLDPKKRAQAWNDAGLQMVREGLIEPNTSGARSTATGSARRAKSAA